MNRLGVDLKHEDGRLYHSRMQEVGSVMDEAALVREAQKSRHAAQKQGNVKAILPTSIYDSICKKLEDYGMVAGVNCTPAQFNDKVQEVTRELYSRFATG